MPPALLRNNVLCLQELAHTSIWKCCWKSIPKKNLATSTHLSTCWGVNNRNLGTFHTDVENSFRPGKKRCKRSLMKEIFHPLGIGKRHFGNNYHIGSQGSRLSRIPDRRDVHENRCTGRYARTIHRRIIMIIKVCGMRDPENIREVAVLGIDWIGLIFFAGSPRRIIDNGQSTMAASRIPNCLLPIINCQLKRVGVFVNASQEEMMEMANTFHLDYLQLHGNETPDDCHALQKRGFSLIKAFQIATACDLEQTVDYEGRVDYFLFDTKCNSYGGSGKQFDWSVLEAYRGKTPFLLSGGIRPESAGAIRSFRHPRLAGIDLNSGFEIEPGLKDIGKLKEFLKSNSKS